jgi:hypothetical protein
VDELLLGSLLSLQDLNVVDQQRVELAVARLELLGALGAKRSGGRSGWGGCGADSPRSPRAGASCRGREDREGRAGCRRLREAPPPRARPRAPAGCPARSRSSRTCAEGGAPATSGRPTRALRPRHRRRRTRPTSAREHAWRPRRARGARSGVRPRSEPSPVRADREWNRRPRPDAAVRARGGMSRREGRREAPLRRAAKRWSAHRRMRDRPRRAIIGCSLAPDSAPLRKSREKSNGVVPYL